MPRDRRSPHLGRRQPSKELKPVHWIYCEGKTEAKCLNGLRRHFRVPTAKIEVISQAGVPWTIIEAAKAKKKEARQSVYVHVVFDRDEHPKFREAIQRARDLDLSIGVSVPCFELWAILLHQDQTAHIERHPAQSLLKSLHLGYCHKKHPYLDLSAVLKGLNDARRRSNHLALRAVDTGDDLANPSTTFSQVIDAVFPVDTD